MPLAERIETTTNFNLIAYMVVSIWRTNAAYSTTVRDAHAIMGLTFFATR